MKELVMIIRPEKLEDIKQILDDIHCGGMTLSTVMGCGTQKGLDTDANAINEIRGFKTTINLLPKIRVEVVVDDKYVEKIISAVRENVHPTMSVTERFLYAILKTQSESVPVRED